MAPIWLDGSAVRDFLNKTIKGRGNCAYDSAVIAGNGIGALAFAGWLAQSPLFEGKVTVVAPPVVESRRLINGVSLRGRADRLHERRVGHDTG